MVEWQPVESSNIEAIAYSSGKSELHVKFKSGVEYAYSDVPASVVDDLMAAPSKGKFLAENIKGKYPYSKVED